MCHGANKIQKENWGPGPWKSETVELRNYSEIIPKLLRNWGNVILRNYSEITPKSFRNHSETTPKLGNRGIPKLLRNYGPGLWYSEFTPKLLRNYGTGTVAVELRKLWLAIVLY